MRLAKATEIDKVPLGDIERVREVAVDYMNECAESGIMPSVRGVAARLGVTRWAIYDYAHKHPGGALARWLEDFSDCCGEVMMAAALNGTVSAVPAIFTAKARYSWREAPVQIELQTNSAIGDAVDVDELKKRIAEDVIIDSDFIVDNYGEE